MPETLDFNRNVFLPCRLDAAASRTISARIRGDFGITIPKLRVPVHRRHAGDASLHDIASRVGMGKSRANRSEAAGHSTKAQNDSGRLLSCRHLTASARVLPLARPFQDDFLPRPVDLIERVSRALDTMPEDRA